MKSKKREISKRRKMIFFLLMFSMIISIPVFGVFAYYLQRKLSYSFEFGQNFGRFDDELGWTLEANTSSYLRGRNIILGKTYFDAKIFTNARGFRDRTIGLESPTNGIVAIGDSWTFGYCTQPCFYCRHGLAPCSSFSSKGLLHF
jgi:hypothetical protein